MYFGNNKSFKGYRWKVKDCDERKSLAIYQKYGYSEILSRLLALKDLEIDEIENFLHPKLHTTLKDPNHLLDMEKGVNVVYNSIINKEKICIYGDYDVDGVSSSALMKNFFDLIKVDTIVYIPDRLKEGYGPNIEAFKKIKNENKADLVITVDCGISAFEPCKIAKEIGLKVVITDHHLGSENIPEADAVINPNRLDETTDYKILAGVGVAFLFIISLRRKLRENNYFKQNKIEEPDLMDFLDLVALGTICDVMPLIGINRVLVSRGLEVIQLRKNIGLKTLADISNINETINTYHIGYIIGPRINATGRIGNSDIASKLLYLKDPFELKQIAYNLELLNEERQVLEQKILEKAMDEVYNKELYNDNIIFVLGENWHEGIIGIIASRIKDKFDKPTVVLSKINDSYKASCRSVHGVDLGNCILEAKLKNLIVEGGGHSMAGGFSLNEDKLDQLIQFFNDKLQDDIEKYLNNKEIEVDLVLECKSITTNLAEEIEKLSPFGSSNHKPKIILKDVVIVKSEIVGKNQNTLRLIVCDTNSVNLNNGIIAMSFKTTKDDKLYEILSQKGKKINILGEININKWQGKITTSFIIEDILMNDK